jgi:ABC-type uncharacterized transport system fused permease/ATPase subunit
MELPWNFGFHIAVQYCSLRGKFGNSPSAPRFDVEGEVVQAAAAFVVVQGAFNWMTDSYGRISEWTASSNRVASLLLALDQIDGRQAPAPSREPTAMNSQTPQRR